MSRLLPDVAVLCTKAIFPFVPGKAASAPPATISAPAPASADPVTVARSRFLIPLAPFRRSPRHASPACRALPVLVRLGRPSTHPREHSDGKPLSEMQEPRAVGRWPLPSCLVPAQVGLEEVHRAPPRCPGMALVVGAETVGVIEERVPGALVVLACGLRPGLVELGLERFGVLDRDEVVGGPEMALDGLAVELREVGLAVRHHVVEGRH